jgi:hypothetical protein
VRSLSASLMVATETESPLVLVRCAMCECDQALVRSHADADRVLRRHIIDCPRVNSDIPREELV